MENTLYQKLWQIFKSFGAEALALNHYELTRESKFADPPTWKEFLTSREVSDWIKSEQQIIQTAELNRLINGISKSHSVGQAQIMNTLAKLNETKVNKDGPVFIYTYIPLSPEQEKAENVIKLDIDPFI